jgi:hypothetical protein
VLLPVVQRAGGGVMADPVILQILALRPKGMARRPLQTEQIRQALFGSSRWFACEVCSWRLPVGYGDWGGLNIHHVVPVSAGGSDHPANLVALCPNHHSLAHAITKMLVRPEIIRVYFGWTPRVSLLEVLKWASAEPEALRNEVEASALRLQNLLNAGAEVREEHPSFDFFDGEEAVYERRNGRTYIRGAYDCECGLKEWEAAGADPQPQA